jgi:hypothetical protein
MNLLGGSLTPRLSAMLALVTTTASGLAACGQDLPLAPGCVLRFASVEEGAKAITVRDDFIRDMSPFDRQVLMRTDRQVSEADFLSFFAQHVLPWAPGDVERLAPVVAGLSKKLANWKLALPPVVLLVKTDGQECAGAAYCRGAVIVLPTRMLADTARLMSVLPHELFHVWSTHNPTTRQELYRSIGFELTNKVELPESLRSRKITNPDAPLNNQFITLQQDGRQMELMPILISKSPRYDAARGGTLFDYLDFKLMLLEGSQGMHRPALAAGQPVLFEPSQVPGFAEQVGRNTKYIIHPEEILADNFVFLLDGRINLPSPRVVESMGRILQAAADAR